MTTSGTVVATIAAGVATDAAGNGNTASTSTDNTVTFNAPDTTPPSVTIDRKSVVEGKRGDLGGRRIIKKKKPVSGFTRSGLTHTGKTGRPQPVLLSGSGSSYTAGVRGLTACGTVVATIAAGVATDAAGNGNTASTSTDNTVTFNAADTTPPSVT